jgi:hypothetical protein
METLLKIYFPINFDCSSGFGVNFCFDKIVSQMSIYVIILINQVPKI